MIPPLRSCPSYPPLSSNFGQLSVCGAKEKVDHRFRFGDPCTLDFRERRASGLPQTRDMKIVRPAYKPCPPVHPEKTPIRAATRFPLTLERFLIFETPSVA